MGGTNFSFPTIVRNAPNATALGRYGEVPVSINTGVPAIGVPVYDIHSGKLTLPSHYLM